jgi:thiol:disulfide interchange protein
MKTRDTLALAAALALVTAGPVLAQGSKSDSVVKATAKADKPGDDGKQTVTITLEVDPEFYIYANPVGNEDFDSNKTAVTVTGKKKPESVKVEYPPGKAVKDSVVGDYKIYQGKVTIKAVVQRAKGDAGELAVEVKLQACNKSKCLLPATIKLPVP